MVFLDKFFNIGIHFFQVPYSRVPILVTVITALGKTDFIPDT